MKKVTKLSDLKVGSYYEYKSRNMNIIIYKITDINKKLRKITLTYNDDDFKSKYTGEYKLRYFKGNIIRTDLIKKEIIDQELKELIK